MFVSSVVELDVVRALEVCVERVVGRCGAEGPDLDLAIEAGRGELVGVLRAQGS